MVAQRQAVDWEELKDFAVEESADPRDIDKLFKQAGR